MKTLYVERTVKNVDEIVDWYTAQDVNIGTEYPLHVTIMYCEGQVNWDILYPNAKEITLPLDGKRTHEYFGEDKDTLVLTLNDAELQLAHEYYATRGAVHSWDEYNPHITLLTDCEAQFDGLVPYSGKIVLEPETMAEIDVAL